MTRPAPMRRPRRRSAAQRAAAPVAVALAAALGTATIVAPAHAATAVDAAKANCEIGERIDGYLGVVDGASPGEAARREMGDVNQRRKAAYADLAQRNGVSLADTARVAAETLIGRAASGECVQNAGGQWVRVP